MSPVSPDEPIVQPPADPTSPSPSTVRESAQTHTIIGLLQCALLAALCVLTGIVATQLGSLNEQVGSLNDQVGQLAFRVSSVESSVDSIGRSPVLQLDTVMMKGSKTYTLPVSSIAWSGR